MRFSLRRLAFMALYQLMAIVPCSRLESELNAVDYNDVVADNDHLFEITSATPTDQQVDSNNDVLDELPPVHNAKVNDKTVIIPECENAMQVCSSILWISQFQLIHEGPYCTCSGCEVTQWRIDGYSSLTWYHFERMNWKVQYKFCTDVMPRNDCDHHRRSDSENTVAVVSVKPDGWQPTLIHPHRSQPCRCPDGHYYLSGWKQVHAASKVTGPEWHYNYTCARPSCKRNDACVKHYMDRSLTQTTGYRFVCSCPIGSHCPLPSTDDTSTTAANQPTVGSSKLMEDEHGPYYLGYCHKLPGWENEKY